MKTAKSISTMFIIIVALAAPRIPLNAQNAGIPVQCGDVIEGEFTTSGEEIVYLIDLEPRDQITVSGTSIGDTLVYDLAVNGPSGVLVAFNVTEAFATEEAEFVNSPFAQSGILSERGTYRIYIHNAQAFGLYTLSLQCVSGGPTGPMDESLEPEYPLSPNLENAVLIPLNIGSANQGQIQIASDIVLGYTLDLAAGDIIDLSFSRLSGNLNLGMLMLSRATNQIVFQASLVTTETLSTRFSIPLEDEYVIGIFRMDLLPTETMEPTDFQITVTINP